MLDLLRKEVPAVSALIGGIVEDQWSRPTPCEEMTVHSLAAHLVGGLEQFGDVVEGLPVDVTATTDVEPDEILDRFDTATERMLAGWSAPGAGDAVYPMPWGETPGSMMIGFMVIEVAMHGWDLARATGQDLALDEDVAASVLELSEDFDDESIRVPGMFAPIVTAPDGAATIDRLAAFLGRDPTDWSTP